MSREATAAQVICRSEALGQADRLGFAVLHRGEPADAFVIRVDGTPRAWLNRCVHMNRPLDGEDDEIFDKDEGVIRCSNHGVTYDPDTGECLAPLCAGKSLTALRIDEHGGEIRLRDRHAALVTR